jgi:CheY-like chemotaxis protein
MFPTRSGGARASCGSSGAAIFTGRIMSGSREIKTACACDARLVAANTCANAMPSGVSKGMNTPLRLWLVDDRADFKELYATALAVHGFPCERQFDSAEELIEVLRKTSGPDFLLIDVGLPGMSGAAAVKIVKSLSPTTCVFVITSFKSYKDAAEALSGGANGYFEKSEPLEALAISMRLAMSRQEERLTSKGNEAR